METIDTVEAMERLLSARIREFGRPSIICLPKWSVMRDVCNRML